MGLYWRVPKRPAIRKEWVGFLLWMFLLVFPKGGFKIGEIPLTWGYLFLGLTLWGLSCRHCQIWQRERIYSYLATLPFVILALLTILWNGIGNFGYTLSFFISFSILPLFFYIFAAHTIDQMEELYSLIRWGILFVSSYGIFLFFYKLGVGRFLEIPFLTSNFHDFGQLEQKHIQRTEFLFKLISTYNNGNIYGVCMLLFLPLFSVLERRGWKRGLVKISLLLTLSRTVWLGLLFHECLMLIYQKELLGWIKTLLKLSLIFGAITIIVTLSQFGSQFLLDASLGGRIIAGPPEPFHLFSSLPFYGIGEMVYLSVIFQFGIIGLFLFLFAMLAPLFFSLMGRRKEETSEWQMLRTGIRLGLVNYLFVAFAEGAILYIPTMVFYWFLSSLLHRKTVGHTVGIGN